MKHSSILSRSKASPAQPPETRFRDLPLDFLAEPPKPNPPLTIALAIVGASFLAPILFLRAGAGDPLLGVATLALAVAGIIAVAGAVNGHRRHAKDANCRVRARIAAEGITFYKTPFPDIGQFFPVQHIAQARLAAGAMVVLTNQSHHAPGRHVLRYGRAVTPRQDAEAAIATITHQSPEGAP